MVFWSVALSRNDPVTFVMSTYVQPYEHFKVGPAKIKILAHLDLIGHSMTNPVPLLSSSSVPSESIICML
jgi:hypothetical protein